MAKNRNDPFHVQIGQRIRTYRKRCHLTQEQLALEANWSLNFVGSLERGESGASMKTLRQIANALHVDVQDLVARSNVDQSTILSEIVKTLYSKEWETEELQDILSIIQLRAQR